MHKIKGYGWKRGLPVYGQPKFEKSCMAATPARADITSFMPPVYDQGDLGSCHDDQTEVLTQSGWKFFSNLTVSDKLAAVDTKTKELRFEQPLRVIKIPYKGDLYHIKHRQLDFAVTPDHKMLVRKWNESRRNLDEELVLQPMEEVGWYVGMINQIVHRGVVLKNYIINGVDHKHKPQREDRKVEMKAWLRFLGIYTAEGTMLKGEKKKNHYKIQVAGTKTREREFIRQVLKDIGVNFCELPDRFTFENKQIYMSMKDLGLEGVRAPEKFIPKFVFGLSPDLIENFLHGHFMGDGCEQRGMKAHYTSSKKLADDLQLLIILSGKSSKISSREARTSVMKDGRKIIGRHKEYRISVRNKPTVSVERKKQVYKMPYNGYVYCAEVPTHTLITRRNGCVLISGNCTANAAAGLAEYLTVKNGWKDYTPSRLAIYYWERELDGSIEEDAGSSLASAAKVLHTHGAPNETNWRYDIAKFTHTPTANVVSNGKDHIVLDPVQVRQTLDDIRACVSFGYPIMFGFTVYDGFEGDEIARTGVLSMPKKTEKIVGGHAVLIVGYDDYTQMVKVRNSWGPRWGQKGYFWMPYSYVEDPDLCDDFWSAHKMTGWKPPKK